MRQGERVLTRVTLADSRREGGCNFCSRHTKVNGEEPHLVAVLHGVTWRLRACERCAEELRQGLSLVFGLG